MTHEHFDGRQHYKVIRGEEAVRSGFLFLQEGEKAGIIGINGTGKSTLLRMIAGAEEPDEGQIIRANGKVISFLTQHPKFEENDTVLEAVMKTESPQGVTRAQGESEDRAKNMMTRLGITDFTETCGCLSGGQRKRLALIRTLLSPADILILDEPTNHWTEIWRIGLRRR